MTLIIGIGNPDRGDDVIGLLIARRIRQGAPAAITVIESTGDGAALMDIWSRAEHVIVIDAAHGAGKAGTIHRFDAIREPLPSDCVRCSTHTFALPEAIEMSRVLGQLPHGLIVYAIVGKRFDLGAGVSPRVHSAGREVAKRVLLDIHAKTTG